MSTPNISSVEPHIIMPMQPPPAYFTLPQPFMPLAQQQLIHSPANSAANSPRPSAPVAGPPPPYSVCSFDQERVVIDDNQAVRDYDGPELDIVVKNCNSAILFKEKKLCLYEIVDGPGRWTLVLRAYLLIVILLLATMTLVALSKLLPPTMSNPFYSHHWIYYASGIAVVSSLIVLSIWQITGLSSSLLKDCWIILLWGGCTVNLILIGQRYTLNSVYLAGCLTIVSSVSLTLVALQLKTDLTKKGCELLVLLCGVAAFVVSMFVLRGEEDARTAASAAWIATSALMLPFLTQIIAGGRQLELPKEDFIIAVALLYTLMASTFQHILFFT